MQYKNLRDLKEQRPQLVKRLLQWGLTRNYKFGFINQQKAEKGEQGVINEIEQYLDEVVFTPTKFDQAKDNLIK